MDNTGKFTGKAEVYAQARPGYPEAFLEYISKIEGSSGVVADVGSGTGKLTAQLLDCGYEVFAVEPNGDMRSQAEGELLGRKGFKSVEGSDRNTGLPDHSVDFITVAQAFHWFDGEAFKLECRRILKETGRVYLIWNSRVESAEVTRRCYDVCKEFCPNFKGFSGGLKGDYSLVEKFFQGDFQELNFSNDLFYDRNTFVNRILSSSYALLPADDRYEAFKGALDDVFREFEVQGRVLMPNETKVFTGRV